MPIWHSVVLVPFVEAHPVALISAALLLTLVLALAAPRPRG